MKWGSLSPTNIESLSFLFKAYARLVTHRNSSGPIMGAERFKEREIKNVQCVRGKSRGRGEGRRIKALLYTHIQFTVKGVCLCGLLVSFCWFFL